MTSRDPVTSHQTHSNCSSDTAGYSLPDDTVHHGARYSSNALATASSPPPAHPFPSKPVIEQRDRGSRSRCSRTQRRCVTARRGGGLYGSGHSEVKEENHFAPKKFRARETPDLTPLSGRIAAAKGPLIAPHQARPRWSSTRSAAVYRDAPADRSRALPSPPR